ncbi:MAG: hypothetical protein LBR39_08255 [Coriobacteriales bacterium]|nr:hypothetical protein [Coriobacteriales bacterium]
MCKTLCEDITLTHCAECGAELAPYVPPVPRYCNRQQELCANPCGKAEAVSLSHNPCPLHTRVVEG